MFISWEEKQNWYLGLIKSGVSGNAVIVAYIIATYVNGTDDPNKRGWSWPTREQILERMGRPVTKSNLNMVSTWVNQLGESGWIDVSIRPLPDGGKKNFYRLVDGNNPDPRKLTTTPKNLYPEAQESLPRDPSLLGDKSKIKVNQEVKEEVKTKDIPKEVKENEDNSGAKAPEQSLINTEDNSLISNEGYSLTSNKDILLDDEEINPKPKKVGFGKTIEAVPVYVSKRTTELQKALERREEYRKNNPKVEIAPVDDNGFDW